MKLKDKKVLSIEPFCTEDKPCSFIGLLCLKKCSVFPCSTCQKRNKLIVRVKKIA